MSLKKRIYLGRDGRTPIAARSFADLSCASGPVELGLEKAYVRFEMRMERRGRSSTGYSRGMRGRLTGAKTEELVRTRMAEYQPGEGRGERRGETGDRCIRDKRQVSKRAS